MDNILVKIVIILAATKILGILSRKLKMPEVLGALVAGIILGPIVFNLVKSDESIEMLANIGVILLMFFAGMETDVEQFKKAGQSAFVIALLGVVLPLGLGVAATFAVFNNLIESIFIGVILTATSVSITVATLNELGKLRSRTGVNILGAAVIDDIIGLLLLSILFAYTHTGSGHALLPTILGIVGFCIVAALMVIFLPKLINRFLKNLQPTRAVFSFAICGAILAGFLAEEVGIAAIIGAYVFGLIISQIKRKEYFKHRVKIISSGFLSPIFFAYVGLSATREGLTVNVVLMAGVMIIVGVIGKVVGCGAGAKLFKYKNSESLQIGIGMAPRGEVAIITANMGYVNGIITQHVFVATILFVLATAIVTPILLKLVYTHRFERKIDHVKDDNADKQEKTDKPVKSA